jgi:hypothetical protein
MGRRLLIHLVAAAVLMTAATAHARDFEPGDFIAGVRGGYSLLAGYYAGELSNGLHVGIDTEFLVRRWFMAEAGFSYAGYPLENSPASLVHAMALSFGPLFHYPLFPGIRVYCGTAFQGILYYFNNDEYGRRTAALKPGGVARAGFFFNAAGGIMARIGAEYSLSPLSGLPFHSINITAGVSYNYMAFSRASALKQKPGSGDDEGARYLDRLYAEGVGFFREGNVAAAKERFNAIESRSKSYRDVGWYREIIVRTETSLAEGKRLLGKALYFEALPYLEEASEHSGEGRDLLDSTRRRLSAEVPGMEKAGVAAYESGDYEQCIAIMTRIQSADPENRTMKIYLPRARKRQEALKKFR